MRNLAIDFWPSTSAIVIRLQLGPRRYSKLDRTERVLAGEGRLRVWCFKQATPEWEACIRTDTRHAAEELVVLNFDCWLALC